MCSLLDRCAVKKDTFRPLCLVRKVKSLKRDFELPLFQIVFLRSIYFNYIYFNFTPFLLQYAHVYVVIRVYEKCGRLYQDKLKLQAHRLLFHLGILGLLNPMTSTLAIHVLKKVVFKWCAPILSKRFVKCSIPDSKQKSARQKKMALTEAIYQSFYILQIL